MEKICIFCGQKPESKTMEHVLPLWLLELTGDPNRVVRLGMKLGKKGFEEQKHSFKEFKFPACDSCNSIFGELENLTKPVILKMLEYENISASEIDTLLDWFDKVRIGLWLAFHKFLQKNWAGIRPNYHIAGRIGAFDRVLLVCRSEYYKPMLSFFGCDTPAFFYAPCCFSLSINNLSFLNLSYNFLFARRFGFPFPEESFYSDYENIFEFRMVEGRKKIIRPLLKNYFSVDATEIYQPMFKPIIFMKGFSELYDDDYVKERCIDWRIGIGKIFIRAGREFIEYSVNVSDDWIPDYEYSKQILLKKMAIETIKWQLNILKLKPSYERLDKDRKALIKRQINFSKNFNKDVLKKFQTINSEKT